MMRRLASALVAAACMSALPVSAGAGDEGPQNNHTAVFLRQGVDARHLAMGGVGAALADDVAAGYWNPAGLAMIRGWSATGMATAGLNFDRQHSYAAGAWGGESLAFGLSWINAGTDEIQGADASGTPTETFSFSENAIIGSMAAQAGNANLGLSAKLITQDLGTAAPEGGDDTALGYGVDVGAQLLVTQFARLGLVLQDVFGKIGDADTDRQNQIPTNFRVGLSLEPLDGLIVTSDLERARDVKKYRFRGGVEYEAPLGNELSAAVRLGVHGNDYSGGFGVEFGVLSLDYAYVIEPEVFLDANHRVSLTVNLGGTRRLIRADGGADPDNDGIYGEDDLCPDAPEDYDSYQDLDGCPDLDNDGDGIPDLDDPCPDDPEDHDGFQDEDGCPEPDNDKDGIADVDDRCPNEAETVNGFEDDDGCPDEGAVTFPPAYLNFATGSADLPGGGAYPVLDHVVVLLRDHPELRVEVQGHTDSLGGEAQNLALSKRRAERVREYLVGRGIDPSRIRARGFGEARPIAPNDTPEGRARNRRIEFVSIGP